MKERYLIAEILSNCLRYYIDILDKEGKEEFSEILSKSREIVNNDINNKTF